LQNFLVAREIFLYMVSRMTVIDNLSIIETLTKAVELKYEKRGESSGVAKAAALGSLQGLLAVAMIDSPLLQDAIKRRLEVLGVE
jgi:hypothetical protein